MQKNVGLDVHKKFIYGVVLDSEGEEISKRKFKTEPHEMDRFMKPIAKDTNIALESCSCWEYVYDYLGDAGYINVQLAAPSKVRFIAMSKKKTDYRDAKTLANLVRTNMLPTSYAPTQDIRDQRLITRHRASLGQMKRIIKNKIHAILTRKGITHDFDDVFTQEGIEFIRSQDYSSIDRYQIDNYLSILRHYDVQIAQTEKRIQDYVEFTPQVKLLMSIPGVSYYSGLMITGEIGDIRRFNSAKQLTSFAGLNPSVSQSGERCHTGHISKQGDRHLRWILGQCANVAIKHDSTLAKIYQRIKKRRGHNIAITAVARKILCYIFVMLTQNIAYQSLQIHKKNKAS